MGEFGKQSAYLTYLIMHRNLIWYGYFRVFFFLQSYFKTVMFIVKSTYQKPYFSKDYILASIYALDVNMYVVIVIEFTLTLPKFKIGILHTTSTLTFYVNSIPTGPFGA